MRALSLQEMALAVRQRIDIDGQQNAYGANSLGYITDQELTAYLNASIGELWDILTTKFGQNYYLNFYDIYTTSGVYSYQLPFDFKDLQAVDAVLNSGLKCTILPYTTHDRNRYSYSTPIVYPYGLSNLRYQLQGQTISFIPYTGTLPGDIQLTYTPCAPVLVMVEPLPWAANTNYEAGALIEWTTTVDSNEVGQVFLALNAGTSSSMEPSFNVPGTTTDNNITWAYKGLVDTFQTTFDGISGWEDYVILDAAIKCGAKQEMDTTVFMAQKQAMMQRIEWASANRQSGDPVVAPGGFGQMEGNNSGFGWGWGGGGW